MGKATAGSPENLQQPQDHRLGSAYNQKFAEWMVHYSLDDIDQADRSNLFN